MKFSMNGALTIGTLDGANVEIRRDVGPENFFLFGLTVEEVDELRRNGYRPRERYEGNPELREVIDRIRAGEFSRGDGRLFEPLTDSLLNHDPFLLLADYASYVERQESVSRLWRNQEQWTRASILNVARTGRFSSDRAISEYRQRIWRL